MNQKKDNMQEKIIEANYEEIRDGNIYLIDNPCEESEDSIGFTIYVDNLLNIIKNTSAKMIGLISNYGSGKSTIIKMVRDKFKDDKKIKFCIVNLWSLPSTDNKKTKNDLTVDIHKSFLNQIIRNLDISDMQKKSLEKQINKNYGFFDIVIEDKNFTRSLYLLFMLLIFIIILKIDFLELNVPRMGYYLLLFTLSINIVNLITKSKIYFSFNKESKNNREIDEYETIDCFLKIIKICKEQKIEKLVICIEDIDRFSNDTDSIRFLEQIYKFYSESIHEKNIDIKFIVSIKPATEYEIDIKKQNDEIKNIYEKIFDFIITLNQVAIQNYDALIKKMLISKESMLSEIGIEPPNEKYYWSYLYRGKKITIRDIKHRYNYAINLYINLLEHKNSINEEDIYINIDSCFFVAYLEDEFSQSFYKLISDSKQFENIVINYLHRKELLLCDKCKTNCEEEVPAICPFIKEPKFISEIKYGLDNNLIDMNFSMYFYKYPIGKKIKNIYNSGINNMILKDEIFKTIDFNYYVEKSDKSEIINSLNEVIKYDIIPNIIFKSARLFDITYSLFNSQLLKFINQRSILNEEKKVLTIINDLVIINNENSQKILIKLVETIMKEMNEKCENDFLVDKRLKILSIVKDYKNIYKYLFSLDLPKISFNEMKEFDSYEKIFKVIEPSQIDEALIEEIKKLEIKSIEFNHFIEFLEKIIVIDNDMFAKLFYSFDINKMLISSRKKFRILHIQNLIEVLELEDPYKYLDFCKFLNFNPSNLEKVFIEKINYHDDKNELVNKYINLIKDQNKISINAMKFLNNYSTKYPLTCEIEEQLYENGYYNLYVYSKALRMFKFDLDVIERREELLKSYIYFFKNSNKLGKSLSMTKEMAEYLFPYLEKDDISSERRNLFKHIEQKFINIQYIMENKDNDYINDYLSKINFNLKEESKIFQYIYDWAIKDKNLKKTAYNNLVKKFSKKYKYKFSKIKKNNFLIED